MLDPDHNASPFNDIPPVVVALVAAICLIEIAFQLGASGLVGGAEAVGWRINALERFAFFDTFFEWMRRNGTFPMEGMMRFVTYPFVHYEAMHAIFAAVLLLAMGKFVAERFSTSALLAIFVISAVAGALGYGLLLNEPNPLVGAYPAVYGLIGAYTWTLFTSLDEAGENRLRAFQLIGILVGLQLIFKLMAGGGNDWVADLFGFAAGFALSIVLSPGGIGRLMARMRNR